MIRPLYLCMGPGAQAWAAVKAEYTDLQDKHPDASGCNAGELVGRVCLLLCGSVAHFLASTVTVAVH